jgi:hypothetical protein
MIGRYKGASMLRISALVALTVTLLIGSAGCSEKTFKVVFANHLAEGHDIACYMNGNLLGNVVSGATGEFSASTRKLEYPSSPSSQDYSEAEVVFTARDLSTGILSQGIKVRVSTDRTAYVDVNATVF